MINNKLTMIGSRKIYELMIDKFGTKEFIGDFNRFYESMPQEYYDTQMSPTFKKLESVGQILKNGVSVSEMTNFSAHTIEEFIELKKKHGDVAKKIFNTNDLVGYHTAETKKIYGLGLFADVIENLTKYSMPYDVIIKIVNERMNNNTMNANVIVEIIERIVECNIMMRKFDKEIIKLKNENAELLWLLRQKFVDQ